MNITKEILENVVRFKIKDFSIKQEFNNKNELISIDINIQREHSIENIEIPFTINNSNKIIPSPPSPPSSRYLKEGKKPLKFKDYK